MNDITDILRELLDRYSNTPELDEEFERIGGKGEFLANLGILVGDDSSVEINCDSHS